MAYNVTFKLFSLWITIQQLILLNLKNNRTLFILKSVFLTVFIHMFRDSPPASIEHISKHWELDCCFVSSSLVWTSQLHDSHFNVLQHPSAPCLNQRLSGESFFLKTSYTSNSLNAPWEEPGPFFEKNNEEAKAILFPSLRLQGSQTKVGNPGFNGDQHLNEVLMRRNSFTFDVWS